MQKVGELSEKEIKKLFLENLFWVMENRPEWMREAKEIAKDESKLKKMKLEIYEMEKEVSTNVQG